MRLLARLSLLAIPAIPAAAGDPAESPWILPDGRKLDWVEPIEAMARLAPARAASALSGALSHDHPFARQLASGLLGDLAGSGIDCPVALIDVVFDDYRGAATAAIGALRRYGARAATALPFLERRAAEAPRLSPEIAAAAKSIRDAFRGEAPAEEEPLLAWLRGRADADRGSLLLDALAAEDWRVRGAAAGALADGSPGGAALAAIPRALKDPSPYVRRRAAGGLERLGRVAELAQALADERSRVAAAEALERLGPRAEAAVGSLVAALRSLDYKVAPVARALGAIGPPAAPAAEPLAEWAGCRLEETADAALDALGSIGPGARSAGPALVRLLRQRGRIPGGALPLAIGRIGYAEGAAPLASFLGDSVLGAPSAVALSLLGDAGADAIAGAIGAARGREAAAAMRAVAATGTRSPAVRAALEEAASSEDEAKARGAIAALLLLEAGESPGGGPLEARLGATLDRSQQLAIAQSVPASLPSETLAALLDHTADGVRWGAAIALASRRDGTSLAHGGRIASLVAGTVFFEEEAVRRASAVALRALVAEDAVPALVRALCAPEYEKVAPGAAEILAAYGSAAVPSLLGAIERGEAAAGRLAALALGRLEPLPGEAAMRIARAAETSPELAQSLAGSLGRSGAEGRRALVALLASEKAHARKAGGEALRRLGGAALPALEEAVSSDDPELRAAAAGALGALGAKALTALAAAVRDSEATVRCAALRSMSKTGAGGIPHLRAALRDPDPGARKLAARGLQRKGELDPETVVALREALAAPELRADAVDALATGGRAGMDALLLALDAPEPELRAAVLAGLGKVRAAPVPPVLARCEDPEPIVRIAALSALAALRPGAEILLPALGRALSDPRQEVRFGAAKVAGRLGAAAAPAIRGLLAGFERRPEEDRKALLDLLDRCGDVAVPLLADLLEEGEGPLRVLAAEALGRLGRKAVRPLAALLRSENATTRRRAARSLSFTGSGAVTAVGDLANALEDPVAEVVFETAITLGRLGEAALPAREALEKALLRFPESVAIRDAIRRIAVRRTG